MGGWTGEGKDTIEWDGTIRAKNFQGGGSGLTNVGIPGEVKIWGGTIASIPSGYLLCDGASLLRASYPALFAAIGTNNGAVDGNHFNLPALTNAFVVGANADASGKAKSTILGAAQQSGGSNTHAHTGTTNGHTHLSAAAGSTFNDTSADVDVESSTDTFTSDATSTIPTFWALAYIIKT